MKTSCFLKTIYYARILTESARFPPFGLDIVEIGSNSNEGIPFFASKAYCAGLLIDSTRFPLFGFDIAEISSNSKEDITCFQKELLFPDSDRERSVSPLRVRYSGEALIRRKT